LAPGNGGTIHETAEPGKQIDVPAAVRHDLFGLAQDGKTDSRGLPGLLQPSLLVAEFRDVIRFTHPPQVVQVLVFGLLAPIARLLGYQGSYPGYLARRAATGVPLEP